MMRSQPTDLACLAKRVDRLERRNRALVPTLIALLLASATPLLLGATKSDDAKTVDVTRLVLRDGKGAVRAELGIQPEGSPALSFLDPKGATTAVLRGVATGPILEMSDGAGGSVWLSSSATGASLSLGKGKGEIELATNSSGESAIKILDREGKTKWHAP